MRGADITQESLFTTVQLEAFVLTHHPLRGKRELMDTALNQLNGLFDSAYADLGRASIAPERLLRRSLLQQGGRHLPTGDEGVEYIEHAQVT